jgi:hypothetical protein
VIRNFRTRVSKVIQEKGKHLDHIIWGYRCIGNGNRVCLISLTLNINFGYLSIKLILKMCM